MKNIVKVKIKKIIKLLIPPILIIFYYKLRELLFLGIKPRKKYISTIKNYKKQTNKAFVIGNGPSLTETFNKHFDLIKQHDCIVVNSFVNTEYYEQLKPRVYVLADGAYFEKFSELNISIKDKITNTAIELKSKTRWRLYLCVPDFAKTSDFISVVNQNQLITVLYFNTSRYSKEVKPNNELFALYDNNLVYPPAQTVLNTCIYLTLFWEYPETYLIGADTSWHKNLYVDQKTNFLYLEDAHVYGKEDLLLKSDADPNQPQVMAEQLSSITIAFMMYDLLEKYADYKKMKVFNASAFSFITSFERYELNKFKQGRSYE